MTRRQLGLVAVGAVLFGAIALTASSGPHAHSTSHADRPTAGQRAGASSGLAAALAAARGRTGQIDLGIGSADPSRSGMVTLAGSVIEIESNQGVGDVEVVFRGATGESTGVTAADGSYRIDVPAGVYRAFVRSDSVLSVGSRDRELIPEPPKPDDVDAPDETVMPTIVATQSTSGIELPVRIAGVVTGTVKDTAGHPIAGVAIRAAGPRSRPALGSDVTESDAAGTFEMRVPVGYYMFEASHPRFAGVNPADLQVTAKAKNHVELTMVAGCIIKGRVVKADGSPSGDGAIEKQWGAGETEFGPAAKIADDGTFQYTSTEPGPVVLRAWPWKSAPSDKQSFACADGARFEHVTLTISKAAPDLAGILVDHEGKPVAFADVEVAPLDDGGMAQQERTDAAGHWAVYLLPAGRYALGAHAANRGAADLVVQSPQQNVRLALTATGRIEGTTTTLAEGAFELDFYGCGGENWHAFQQERRLVRVQDGRFTVDDVPACQLGMIAKWRGQANHLQADVPPGGVVQVEVAIGPEVAKTVNGVVTDASGAPVANAEVQAAPGGEEGEEGGEANADGDGTGPSGGAATATTDARGHYTLTTVAGAQVYVSTATAFGHGMVPYTKTDRDTVNIALTEATEEDPEVVGSDPGTPEEPAVEDDSGGEGDSPRGEPVIEELL